mmetsp:Transcript_96503/g.166320  ORF Transcript_96503/g.166320 Transcript_96503/m.166320 type:complete len:89 (+) Transcript_96503:1151-1417(+)
MEMSGNRNQLEMRSRTSENGLGGNRTTAHSLPHIQCWNMVFSAAEDQLPMDPELMPEKPFTAAFRHTVQPSPYLSSTQGSLLKIKRSV